MAAVTPATVTILGNSTAGLQVKCSFTDVDDGDTWTSGISGIVAYHFTRTDNPTTQASNGADVELSSGVFTFRPGEDNAAGDLYVTYRG